MSLNSSPIQQGSAPQPAGFWSFPWPDPQLDRPAVDNAIVKARKMVVISSGTLGTPQILERSGVGDAKRLQKLDIKVVSDLPGVG